MKKPIALLLVVLMTVTLLAGCGNNGDANPSATPAVSQQPSNNNGSDGNGLPLTDSPVTLTAWWPAYFTFTAISKMEENLVFTEMADRTNVSVEFITPTQGSESETFNILMASQDYPDMISSFTNYYNKGLDFAIEDMVILPIEDYLPIMPNINALRESNEGIRKGTTTDNGHFAGIPFVRVNKNGDPQGAWVGGVIRQDWLDELNLNVPKTYNQMETTLKAMQDNGLAENPLWLRYDGFTLGNIVNGGYNVKNDWYQIDGTVKYGAMEPEFRLYLEKLNDWYNKKFIAPDFFSAQDFFGPIDKVANNVYAVFDAIYTWNITYKQAAADPNFKLSAFPSLVENEGDVVHIGMTSDIATTSLVLGSETEHAELICRFWDYLFSEEGILLSNYGVEGVTFEYDADGNPAWSGPLVSDAPEFNLSDMQGAFFLFNTAGYTLFDRELSIVEPEAVEFVDTWNQVDNDYFYPGTATMTADEGLAFANVMGDIQTYLSENIVKFIIGDKSFDEYDAFVAQIKSMGIDTAIASKQAALDRYNAR